MNKKLIHKFEECAYKIIREEGLPSPTQIRFINSLSGLEKREGTCIKSLYTNTYRIIIHLTKAKYIKDDNGRYIRSDGIRCRKAVIGEKRTVPEIIKILGHEIAHLKFWKHNSQHISYTNHIIEKLKNKIEGVPDGEI